MTRSFSPISVDRALSIDVLPVPVPPEMTMFFLSATQSPKNSIADLLIEPRSTRSGRVKPVGLNFLIVKQVPLREAGGIIA